MTDTKGNIRARKLGNTGITEPILAKIANAKGGHILAIVELKADTIHEQVDGDDRTVDFLIEQIEAVTDGKLNGALVEHVREINAALHRNRMLAENGPQLPLNGDGPEPTVAEVLAARDGLIGHDDAGEPVLLDDDEPANPDDPAYDPHDYVPTGREEDFLCGFPGCAQERDAAIHTNVLADSTA